MQTALISGASSGIGEALAGRTVPKWLLRRVSGILGRYTARS